MAEYEISDWNGIYVRVEVDDNINPETDEVIQGTLDFFGIETDKPLERFLQELVSDIHYRGLSLYSIKKNPPEGFWELDGTRGVEVLEVDRSISHDSLIVTEL